MVLRCNLKRLLADEGAATAIEYGLICGMIAVVIIGISATGGSLTALYDKLTNIVSALGGSGNNSGRARRPQKAFLPVVETFSLLSLTSR